MEKKLNFTRNFLLKTSTTPPKGFIGVHIAPSSSGDFAQLFSRFNSKFNKVKIVLFLVLGFSITQAVAQRDQITTQAGEKIRCRILDETPTRFIYAYLSPAGKVLRNEIFKNLVSDFKYNFYSSDIVTKGNKLPDGLGGTREENATASARVDTRKGEQPSKQSSKEDRSASEPQKETKKADEKVAQSSASEKVVAEKGKESEAKKTTETDKKAVDKTPKKEEKVANKTPKKTPTKETKKPVAKAKEEKMVTPLSPKNDNNEFNNYLKWRIGVRGGFGNMLAKIETTDEYSLYQEKLLRGWTWGADASYFFGDNFGLGLMFNNFQSQNKAENIDYKNLISNEDVVKGSLSNKRSTKFVGPVMYFRKNIDFKTMVVLGLAPGAYLYKDKGTYNENAYTFKGLDFGAAATLGVDFLLGNDITGRDIILSLEAGYNYGKMRALDFGNGGGAVNLSTPINLSRVDFTIGLRFTRYPKYFKQ
jgi:hypothetical protein